jgi:hypothetical protein
VLYNFFTDAAGQRSQTILFFCRLDPFSPHAATTAVFLGPAFISLLLTNTVSPVRACPNLSWERFRGTQEEDDRGPLIVQSSLRQAFHACVSQYKLFS